MNRVELFETWAPAGSPWSRWAKPVLFAEMGGERRAVEGAPELARLGLRQDAPTAVVVDLPGEEAVMVGLALAQDGYRPVPLFNGARGPLGLASGLVLVPVEPVVEWLWQGAEYLERVRLPESAPPAFLLDERRQSPQASPAPGRFDNRWMVFPQDFPSANFLRGQGIRQVLLLQGQAGRSPAVDLAHVLLRWQQGGLALFMAEPSAGGAAQPLVVGKPSRFRSLWYGVLALAGLRRNSAGGFGSLIPQVSSGAG